MKIIPKDYSMALSKRGDPDGAYYAFYVKKDWWEERKKHTQGKMMSQQIVDALCVYENYKDGKIESESNLDLKALEEKVGQLEAGNKALLDANKSLESRLQLMSDKIDRILMSLIPVAQSSAQ